MAGQEIIFNFLSRGAATLQGDFRKVGDDAALSSRGVQVLGDVISKLGDKADRTAVQSRILASALRQTGDASAIAAAKMVAADAAVARVGEQMKASEQKSTGLSKALKGLSINPGLLGPLVALTPAIATLGGVAVGAAAGLAGSFVAGGAALAAFGAVAKPVLTSALTASQAVNTAQNTYQATVKAGVPVAQAQATLQAANSRAVLTYNAALAGGANPAKALAAEHLALARNQLAYNSATNAGTFNAKAYATQQAAIAKAYADLSPQQIALSKQLGAMADAWQKVKAAQTPVVAGALQPWLASVTSLTKQLGPIIAAVAPVIARIGTQFNILISSSAFIAFRNFIAGTGSAAVAAFGNLLTGFLDAVITLLPKFNPLIQAANKWLYGLGDSIARWANSQKTADQITAFMAWFKTNGPLVGGLLTNIGLALKALAPGLATGAAVEIKLISDFFGLVAKLPPAFAKPIAEVAGALLILSKMGVLKVGVQIIGAAAKWLTGGIISLGGDAAAAAMRAAFATGGTAAAAEMRAALAGGGATAGAEGAAGGTAAKGIGIGGVSAAAGAAALGLAAAGAFVGALIRGIGDKLSPNGSFAGSLNKMFQGLSGPISTSVLHAFTFGGLEAWLTAKIGIPVGRVMNNIAAGAVIWGVNIGKAVTGAWSNIANGAALWWGNIRTTIAGAWNTTWNNTVTRAANGVRDVQTWFSNLRAGAATAWAGISTTVTGLWNTLWNNTVTRASNGVKSVETWFANLRAGAATAWAAISSQVTSIWNTLWANTISRAASGAATVIGWFNNLRTGAGNALNAAASGIAAIWNTIWANTISRVSGGVGTVVSWFAGLRGKITSALGAAGSVLASWGSGVISGLLSGMNSIIGSVWSFIKGIPGKILSFLGIKSPPQWAIDAGKHIMNGIGIGMTQAQTALQKASVKFASATAAAVAGSGVQRWAPTVLKALAMEGLPANLLQDVLYQMQTESGGNPNIVNNWDSNAAAGTPSKGLMQVIQPTFAAYHWPGTSWNLLDPLANIAAALNYASHGAGFGSGPGQIGSGHGYAYGTMSALPGMAWVGERGPELVRFRGGEQVIPAGHGTGGGGDLGARLDRLIAEVRNLNNTAAAIPAATGRHVGGAISGAAGAAAYRNRYPAGGS